MVACAAKNNSRGKKMKTIDEDATLAPDNPIEEGMGTMQLHKGSATSHGETSVMVSEEQLSKKEITGTSHKAGNSTDLNQIYPAHGGHSGDGRCNTSLTETNEDEGGTIRDDVGG